MSNLSISLEALERSRSQLSVSTYFDEALLQREIELIFHGMPRYVGHELSVSEVGDYMTLVVEGEGRALVRQPQGVELISNICRHRQSLMLRGRGHTPGQIVCPLHRWTYDLKGQLIGAPHFDHDPCLHLRNYPLQNWNGLLFEGVGRSVARDLAGLGEKLSVDFSGYMFESAQLHECNYNWKTFIEVYLEDYHVVPFHPGLGEFVNCNDLSWVFGEHYSVQTVAPKNALLKAGSAVYRKWHDELLRYREGRTPEFGAVWLTYYPTVMVEWYPHVLVISTLYPKGPQKTFNMVEFYYPEEIKAFEPDFIKAQQAAYWETCEEDDEIAHHMDAGRKALLERGEDEAGPYQSPMEDGMKHFHEWYRKVMKWSA